MIKKAVAMLCILIQILLTTSAYAEQAAPVQPVGHQVTVAMVTPEPVIMDLASGARGNEVLTLQKRLAVLGFFYTAEDGIYGANTKAAVMEYENYLRLLEQDEIDRMIEAQKTPEPTASPSAIPQETPQMSESPSASPAVDGEPSASPSDGGTALPEATEEPTPVPTPEPTPEPTPVPTPSTVADGAADSAIQEILYGDADALYRRDARFSDRGADVTRIQRRLVYMNYLNDEPDGAFGVNTETAVRAFQAAHDLESTGIADRETQAKLFSDQAIRAERPVYNQLYLWVTGEDVKTVQRQLIYLGFMNGTVSGTYDERTQAAVGRLETYLHELEMAERGVQTPAPTSTPVPEDVLENQGKIEGDPESNPYEVTGDEPVSTVAPTATAEATSAVEPTATAEATAAVVATDTTEPTSTAESSSTTDPTSTNEATSAVEPTATAEATSAVKATATAETTATAEATATAGPTATVEASSTAEPVSTDASAPAQPEEEPFVPTGIMTAQMQTRILEEGIPVYRQTMQKGDTGEEVMRLQRRLYSLGYLTANGVDGIFGNGSETAVKSFQTRNKLEQTGIADQDMQAALFSEDAVRSIKPYQIKISVEKQRVYVYTHDENDQYNILVKTFVCSTGTRDNPTPLGTFTNTGRGARWHYFRKFECWAQYAYYINGDIMFHSVLYDKQDVNTLRKGSVNQLGSRASHGCVRLAVDDAKWIWNNCAAGTTVIVY